MNLLPARLAARPWAGFFISGGIMINEPAMKRVVTFIDGQNLFYAVRECFGYTYPNTDARALSLRICELQGWSLTQVRFYTGVPDKLNNPVWHDFWALKKTEMGRLGIKSLTCALRYRKKRKGYGSI